MAAVGPLRVALGPSVQTQPFDIDILCAKLEVAKREQEEREAAAALRKQVIRSVRKNDGNEDATTGPRWKRRSKTTPAIDTTIHEAQRNERHANDMVTSPQRPHPQQNNPSYVKRNDSRTHVGPASADREESNHILISRSESGSSQQTPNKFSTTKRRPFTLFKNLTDDTDSRTQRRLSKDRPEDVAKRRSVLNRLQSEPIPEHASWTDFAPAPPSISRRKPVKEHTLPLVNEYTVCFDTHEANHHVHEVVESPLSMQPLPIDCPSWAARVDGNEGMRSYINLPSMLKKDRKDRTQTSVDELSSPPQSPPPLCQSFAPRSRPHTRSNTAPESLIKDAVEQIKAEERSKKRRSLGGLLHTMFVPNHSSDSTNVYCVAI